MKALNFNDAPLPAEDATVLLPNSARRDEHLKYCRVIRKLRVDRRRGRYDFQGELYAPGAKVDRAQLPSPTVVLECAGRCRIGRGHKRSDYLHLLWRLEGNAWLEVARSACQSSEWLWDLGPIARRLLHPRGPSDEEIAQQVDAVLLSFTDVIDQLDPEMRQRVCAGVYDRLAAGAVNN